MWKWSRDWTNRCLSEKSHLAGGVACICAGLSDIFGHHTTGADDDIITDIDWHDGCIRADAYAIADGRLFPLVLVSTSRSSDSEWIIDEHGSVTDKTILTYCHKFADECVALHTCACPNRYSALNFNKGAYKHAATQCATVKVHGFNQCDILAELNIDDAVLVDSGFAHGECGGNLSLEWVGCIMLKACR